MKGRIVSIMRAVSLAMLVAVVLLWASTYFASLEWRGFLVSRTEAEYRPVCVDIATSRGEIRLRVGRYQVPLRNRSAADQKVADENIRSVENHNARVMWFDAWDFQPRDRSVLGWAGFEAWEEHRARGIEQYDGVICNVPCWFLCLVLAVFPAWKPVVRRVRAWRHAAKGFGTAEGKSRRTTAFLWGCVTAGVLLVFLMFETWTIGWSIRRTLGATFFEIAAQDRKLSLTVVRGWPQRQPLTFVWRPEKVGLLYPYRETGTLMEVRRLVGLTWIEGDAYFLRDEDGAVSLLPYGKNRTFYRLGPPTPYEQVSVSLPELAFLVLVPPGVWVAVRAHRRLREYKELKELVCARCGYSLIGNVTGVCSECGRKVLRSAQLTSGSTNTFVQFQKAPLNPLPNPPPEYRGREKSLDPAGP